MTTLRGYTIFASPADYRGRYVVRGYTILPGRVVVDAVPAAVVLTLDEARAAIPTGLVRLDRHPDDPDVIVESWV